jgi:hypothetical protein
MVWLWLLVGCKNADVQEQPPPDLTGIENAVGGNPIVPTVALMPFPSSLYLQEADSITGVEVVIPDEALPDGMPNVFHNMDGFSPAQPIVTWMQGGFDSSTLPEASDPGATLEEGQSVYLVRADTFEKLPVLVEVDLHAAHWSNQALIIRPHTTLAFDTDFVVMLTDDLRTADGELHAVQDAFRALRDDLSTDNDAVEAQREDFVVVNAALDAVLGDRTQAIQAWTFHTRSEDNVTLPTRHMHDVMNTATLGDWTETADAFDAGVGARLIEGTFTVPDFLDDDFRTTLDSDGLPVQVGEREIEVMLSIPDTISGPRPVITFGHGFFSSRDELTWSSLNDAFHEWQVSGVAIDFIGFSEEYAIESIGGLAADLAQVQVLTDQQRQSQAMFTALHRLVSEQLATEYPELDGTKIHYMGISNGGTQGLPIVAVSPRYNRGALIVGGAGWSHFLQRAVQWNSLGGVMEDRFPDPMELQLALSLSQLALDPIDAANYSERLVDNRFDGRTNVAVTIHEAVNDSQVANILTDWCARTANLPLVTPSPRDVWGLDTVTAEAPDGADVTSALFIYDHKDWVDNPAGNLPPLIDNDAHADVRKQDAYFDQVGEFLETGRIIQVCDGACDPD